MEAQNHVFNEEAVSKKRGISGISVDSVYDLEVPEVNCNSKIQDEVQVCADATEQKKARGRELVGSPLSLEDHEMREQYHVIDEIPGKSGENNVPPIDIHAAKVHAADELSGYCSVIKQPLSTPAVGFCENEMGNLKISNAASNAVVPNEVTLLADHSPQKSSRRVTRSSSSLPPGPGKIPVTMGVKDHQTGKVSKAVEKEGEKKLKEKQVSPDAANFSTSAPAETQTYLELAVDLPSFSVRGSKTSGKSIVVLRDSAMRKWPVIYHERSRDTCLISVENASQNLLRLEINRK
ncbi:hypothetical protein MKW94_008126 [Papaver nudicaule]|uniref:Uncharacterized protein n=1 Tax=Papaver nudicaule TaxID=74823 RepID=A0AA42B2N6_PAPNU|nr:hypothetical protein [Papaver nudicaule]